MATASNGDAKREAVIIKVNKWDLSATKNAIDDAVKKAVVDEFDYVDCHKLLDQRLIISVLSCAVSGELLLASGNGMVAGVALLYDWQHPFPQSRTVLILCVLAYFVLMCVLQLFAWYVERGIYYVGIDRDASGKRADVKCMFASMMKK